MRSIACGSLILACASLGAFACGGGDDASANPSSADDGGPGSMLGDGGAGTDNDAAVAPGEAHGRVDPTCLTNGYAHFEGPVRAVLPTATGAYLLLQKSAATVDVAGKLTLGAAFPDTYSSLDRLAEIGRIDDDRFASTTSDGVATFTTAGALLNRVDDTDIGFGIGATGSDASGTIVGGRERVGANGRIHLRRITAAGLNDTSWGTGGTTTPLEGKFTSIDRIATGSDGAIWATGAATTLTMWVARFTADGAVDTSFGSNGSVIVPGNAVTIGDLVPTADGGALVISAGGAKPTVAKVTRTGTLDAAFGKNGSTTFDFSAGATESDHAMRKMLVTPDGRIFAVMMYSVDNEGDHVLDERRIYVFAFLANGAIDTSFGDHGALRVGFGESEPFSFSYATQIAVLLGDHRILIGGSTLHEYTPQLTAPGGAVCIAY